MKHASRSILFLFLVLTVCGGALYYLSVSRQPSTPAVSQTSLTIPELKYILLKQYPDIQYCDPDHYPIAREDDMTFALRAYPTIAVQTYLLNSIAKENNIINRTSLTNDEKLRIYTDYKKLEHAVRLEPKDGSYIFQFMNKDYSGKGNGAQITGVIDQYGAIRITKQETRFNVSCPICLSKNTRISTPNGDLPVQDVREGMPIWTVDASGNRIIGVVVRTGKTPVPATHKVVHLVLDDGRSVFVSPGHPTAEGKAVEDLRRGDTVDGARVKEIQWTQYRFSETYDILTSGYKGMYQANGILLQSTLQ